MGSGPTVGHDIIVPICIILAVIATGRDSQ